MTEFRMLAWQQKFYDEFMKPKNFGLNLYGQTGIGKSFLAFNILKNFKSVLIITPAHLIPDWMARCPYELTEPEINRESKDIIVQGTGYHIISVQKVALYDLLIVDDIDLLIVDEAHRIKNWASNGYKNIMSSLKFVKKFLGMSATYVTKNTTDLFTGGFICNVELRKKFKSSFWKYADENIKFRNQHFGNKSFRIPVEIYEDSLKNDILPYYRRVTYESAGLKAPEYTVTNLPYPVTNEHKFILQNESFLLDAIIDDNIKPEDFLASLEQFAFKNSDYISVLNNISYKVNKTYSFPAKFEALKSIIEGEEGKGLLFYFYKEELPQIVKNLPKSYIFVYENYDSIKEFEKSDKKLLICNLAAFGEGVRIPFVSYIVEFTLSFDFGKVLQGRGRPQFAGREEPYKVFTLVPDVAPVVRFFNNIKYKISAIQHIDNLLLTNCQK